MIFVQEIPANYLSCIFDIYLHSQSLLMILDKLMLNSLSDKSLFNNFSAIQQLFRWLREQIIIVFYIFASIFIHN